MSKNEFKMKFYNKMRMKEYFAFALISIVWKDKKTVLNPD